MKQTNVYFEKYILNRVYHSLKKKKMNELKKN